MTKPLYRIDSETAVLAISRMLLVLTCDRDPETHATLDPNGNRSLWAGVSLDNTFVFWIEERGAISMLPDDISILRDLERLADLHTPDFEKVEQGYARFANALEKLLDLLLTDAAAHEILTWNDFLRDAMEEYRS